MLNGHTSQKAAPTDTRPGAGGRAGWGQAISSLAFGAAAALLFARRQVTAAEPLIRPTLLANRGFTSALLLGLAYYAVVNGILYVISLFLQQAIGYTRGSAALRLVPLTVGLMVGAGACVGLLLKIGRLLVPVGLVLTAAGSGWLLAAVHAHGADLGGWTLGQLTHGRSLLGCARRSERPGGAVWEPGRLWARQRRSRAGPCG